VLRTLTTMSKSAKNALQQKVNSVETTALRPDQIGDHIAYGIITDVSPSYQVKVSLLGDNGSIVPGGNIMGGSFIPLMNPLEDVFLRFGDLREGMTVRIHWRGTMNHNIHPQAIKWAVVEVVSSEDHSFLNKPKEENTIAMYPHKIFSGGLLG
jgi:hypothetical protein